MTQRPRRRRLAKIDDVARLSGVSSATVDRVLNQRPGVRAMTSLATACLSSGFVRTTLMEPTDSRESGSVPSLVRASSSGR